MIKKNMALVPAFGIDVVPGRSLPETDSCSYRHYITHELPEDYDFEQEMETIGLLASRSE